MTRYRNNGFWSLSLASVMAVIGVVTGRTDPTLAQIVPDQTLGAEQSQVMPNVDVRGGLADRIDGGAIRGINLFHSFGEFNVGDLQRVYFANPEGIENILGRVTGSNRSDILGTLGVDGGANLFLINPNGIVFGPNAQLDIRGSFVAGTADRFKFPDGSEFRATNPNAPPLVTVNIPIGLQYGSEPPAALVSEADLAVGQDLALSGGSVTSTGHLSAPEGLVVVEGVAGDVQVQDVTAQSATLYSSQVLSLEESQLRTTGDLNLVADQTVRVRDSVEKPFLALSGGNLLLQGNESVDILALNHPQTTPFQSMGDVTLVSDGNVSGDAHFYSGGNFSILNLAGNPGTFVSLYDPIISVNGNVTFGNYTGVALKVQATGSILVTGNIRITGPDTSISTNSSTSARGDVEIPPDAAGSTIPIQNISLTNAGNAVSATALETFLALANGSLSNLNNNGTAVEGAAIRTTSFTVESNNLLIDPDTEELLPIKLVLDWNFVTNETTPSSFNDFAFVSLIPNGLPPSSVELADTQFSQVDAGDPDGSDDLGSGFIESSTTINSLTFSRVANPSQPTVIEITNAGTYTLGIGIVDEDDGIGDSGLLIENAQLLTPGGQEQLTIQTPNLDNIRLISSPALILRAGVADVQPPQEIGTLPVGGFPYNPPGSTQPPTPTPLGSIAVNGSIDTSSTDGNAGPIILDARENINVSGTDREPSVINASSSFESDTSAGTGGGIEFTAGGVISITNTTIVNTGRGGSGNIAISGGEVSLTGGTTIDAGAIGINGNSGNVSVEARNGGSVLLDQAAIITSINSGARVDAPTSGTEEGNISITGGEVTLQNGSFLSAVTNGGRRGGSVSINASGGTGRVSLNNESGIITTVGTQAGAVSGGSIQIDAASLSLEAGSSLQAQNLSPNGARAGNITLNITGSDADSDPEQSALYISGFGSTGFPSGVITSTESFNTQQGGNIEVNVPNGTFSLSDRAVLSARNLSNNSPGGNVNAIVGNLQVINGGQIITSALGSAAAGNITIDATGNTLISGSAQSFEPRASPFVGADSPSVEAIEGFQNPADNVDNIEFSDRFSYRSIPATGDGQFDYYSFDVQTAGSRGIFDIDFGSNDDDPSTPDIDEGSIDTELFLFNRDTGELLAQNDDFNTLFGGGGSESSLDSYISYVFRSPGTYVIGVGEFNSSVPDTIPPTLIEGTTPGTGDTYTLQISLESPGESSGLIPNQGENSGLFAQSQGFGTGGNIRVTTGSFSLTDDAVVSASTLGLGEGSGGNVNITVSGDYAGSVSPQENTIEVSNSTISTAVEPPADKASSGSGIGGAINIVAEAGAISFRDGASINASTSGNGDGGSVRVETTGGGSISIIEGSRVEARTQGTGNAGNIEVNAPDIRISGSTELNGAPLFSGLFTSSERENSGQVGNITINTSAVPGETLSISDGAVLSALNRSNTDGDDINITVNANILELINGGQIITTAEGSGRAGGISVNSAERVTISGSNPNFEQLENVASGNGLLTDNEANDSRDTAQDIAGNFSLTPNPDIQSSARIPYVSIAGAGDGTYDYYSFTASVGNRGIFDIDYGSGGGSDADIDTELFLFNDDGDLLASNDDFSTSAGANGSTSGLDSFIDYTFLEDGIYFIGVSRFNSDASNGSITGNAPEENQRYTLQVSVDQRNTLNANQGASSGLFAQATGSGNAGDILIEAEQVRLNSGGEIAAETNAGGDGDPENRANITLRGLETLEVNNGLISSSTQSGVAGSVLVDASDSVTVNNGLISSSSSIGVAGDVTINALESVMLNGIFNTTPTGEPQGGVLATATEGGTAGSVTINTEGLTIQNEAAAAVSSRAGSGNAGDIQIEAEEVTLNSGGRIEAQTDAGGSDRPANIILQGLETLDINDGFISSSTESGVAGSVSIDASDSVTVNNGSILSSSNSGRAGSVSIDASQLELNQGTISASTTSTNPIDNGIAGNVSINASDSAELDNGSRIAVTAAGDNGTAGDVIINTGDFLVRDGSEVSVSSEGVAGSLNVNADFIELNQGRLTAEAGQGEGGANINLDVSGFLRLDNESLISALATGSATGGNININAQYVLASFPTGSQGSDIVADAVLGNGGQISITALGIFGLDFRPARTPLNDITASSQGGAAGTVQITTLGIDPSRGLAALPLNFIDVSGLVGGQCSASGADGELSQFTIIGRGGLPLNPTDPLAPEAEASDWVTFDPESDRISPQAHTPIRITPFTSSVSPQQLAQFPSLCYQSWSTSAIAP